EQEHLAFSQDRTIAVENLVEAAGVVLGGKPLIDRWQIQEVIFRSTERVCKMLFIELPQLRSEYAEGTASHGSWLVIEAVKEQVAQILPEIINGGGTHLGRDGGECETAAVSFELRSELALMFGWMGDLPKDSGEMLDDEGTLANQPTAG